MTRKKNFQYFKIRHTDFFLWQRYTSAVRHEMSPFAGAGKQTDHTEPLSKLLQKLPRFEIVPGADFWVNIFFSEMIFRCFLLFSLSLVIPCSWFYHRQNQKIGMMRFIFFVKRSCGCLLMLLWMSLDEADIFTDDIHESTVSVPYYEIGDVPWSNIP